MLNFVESGADSKSIVLLLHPGGVLHSVWNPIIRAWTEDYHLLAPDFMPTQPPLTVPNLAQACWALVASKTTQPIIIVGSSLGANVALQMAVDNPQRVRALILDSAQAGGEPVPDVVRGMVKIFPRIPKFLYVRTLMGQFKAYSASDQAAIRAELQRIGAGAFVQAILATFAHDVRTGLPSLTMPILLTNGAQDPVLKQAEVIQKACPHAEHFIFENAGHSAFLAQPDLFLEQATAFLQKHSLGT